MKYQEIKMDIFDVDKKYNLVHCISQDFEMSKGIALEFDKRFKLKKSIENAQLCGASICVGEAFIIGRVINLVTKRRYYQKPTYESLQLALNDMKYFCGTENIKYVAMPTIACGLDRLSWGKVKNMIQQTFKDTDVEILVCYL